MHVCCHVALRVSHQVALIELRFLLFLTTILHDGRPVSLVILIPMCCYSNNVTIITKNATHNHIFFSSKFQISYDMDARRLHRPHQRAFGKPTLFDPSTNHVSSPNSNFLLLRFSLKKLSALPILFAILPTLSSTALHKNVVTPPIWEKPIQYNCFYPLQTPNFIVILLQQINLKFIRNIISNR